MAREYFEDDDDEEVEDEDQEEYEEDLEEEEEEEEEEDPEEVFARIEKAFRAERALIRTCDDLGELRNLRVGYQELAGNAEVHQAGRIRGRDLMELIDDRITDLKAKRLAERRA